jgi:FKBP-type peptidyl-prolyl cis-trans isomerase FkpA
VIEGWEIGVLGLKKGAQASVFCPAKFAYGDRAVGNIPADSSLLFEIEIIDW